MRIFQGPLLVYFCSGYYKIPQFVFSTYYSRMYLKSVLWLVYHFSPYALYGPPGRKITSISFSLAKGEIHQQGIKPVYKRRARKYFAHILRRSSYTRRQILQLKFNDRYLLKQNINFSIMFDRELKAKFRPREISQP